MHSTLCLWIQYTIPLVIEYIHPSLFLTALIKVDFFSRRLFALFFPLSLHFPLFLFPISPKVTEAEYWGGKLPHSPILIMHAYLINYAFYSLSLNAIHNSLGNWIYTSLITTYCIDKSGFFLQRFFRVVFPSLSPFSPLSSPHFSGGHFLLSILPPRPLSVYFFFYVTCRIRTLNSLSSSSDQQSILHTIVLHVLVANNG